MVTKTALVLGAFKVALLSGCAADVKQQRHSNAAVEQIREQRRAFYADTALSIDDGVSDAGTVGKAVSAHCRKYTEKLIRLASSDGPQAVRSIQQQADDLATTYVIEFRRLKKLAG
jgi:predicted phosphoribosyltransferase